MKKFIYLFILAVAIVTVGCSRNTPTNNQSVSNVVGNTYKYTEGSSYISLYFASNYTCTYVQNVNGEYTSTSNLTYKINGTNVDVYTDNSSTWIESKRNTLLYHMIYYPSSDALVWEGIVFKRYN